MSYLLFFFFSSRRRHTRLVSDWSSDVCSSDLFVMTATAHAVEATAQEFLDKYEHGDVTERQKLLTVIKGLEEGVSWADASRSEERRVGKEWRARGAADD